MKDNNKEKIEAILMNTILNSFHFSQSEEYNNWEEALKWAKSKDYFPDLSEDEFLLLARKYDIWNEFEKIFKDE
ncbi:Uncharacterised protein [[Flavobacterium] thermophilum]|nr:Uncharacterised protein [[Flavobacterium] thermophilum]